MIAKKVNMPALGLAGHYSRERRFDNTAGMSPTADVISQDHKIIRGALQDGAS